MGSKLIPENYGPVSILPNFEKIAYGQLIFALFESNNFCRYGYNTTLTIFVFKFLWEVGSLDGSQNTAGLLSLLF